MADSSFDVVSKIDRQEVDNALNQAAKELSQRYDFRGTNTGIDWSGEETIVITSDAEERAQAGLEVFKEKLIRRDISLKAFDEVVPAAGSTQTAVRISPERMAALTGAEWVDVCQEPAAREAAE